MECIKFEGTSYNADYIKTFKRSEYIKQSKLSEEKAGELYDLVVPPKPKKSTKVEESESE